MLYLANGVGVVAWRSLVTAPRTKVSCAYYEAASLAFKVRRVLIYMRFYSHHCHYRTAFQELNDHENRRRLLRHHSCVENPSFAGTENRWPRDLKCFAQPSRLSTILCDDTLPNRALLSRSWSKLSHESLINKMSCPLGSELNSTDVLQQIRRDVA